MKLFLLVLLSEWSCKAIGLDASALKHIANVTYASENTKPASSSIFSPRLNFEQWRPLTGRGDPLRNDPTYDYEPPVLEKVHYWAEEPRPEPPKPDRKSEVLVLGVSSRRPSLPPRQPPKHHHRQPPQKYEDYSYKLGPHYPMTILVPPPPPPPGHQPPIYLLTEEKLTTPHPVTEPLLPVTEDPAHLTSLYALQEANLIYQSSTISQNWAQPNNSGPIPENVSRDYSGWGPTTPMFDTEAENDTQNFIFNEHFDVSKHPFSFYRPMLSEAPPPPRVTMNPLMLPTFVPTAPPVIPTQPTPDVYTIAELESTTSTYADYDETTTDNKIFQPTPVPETTENSEPNLYDMLAPMMSMPMTNGPEKLEDHLYAFASENLNVFKDHRPTTKLEAMQTMQPPPPTKVIETTTKHQAFKINTNVINHYLHKDKYKITNEPQLTTELPTIASMVDMFEDGKTEPPATPMYLIIQGHSKVKTYSSKVKPMDLKENKDKDMKQKGTQQVKHLLKEKEKHTSKKSEKDDRTKYAKNLKGLLSDGVGSIDLQETDVGIKYDVSDGSDVPIEIYKKGIVESDENDYSSNKKAKRIKRQIDMIDLLTGNINEESVDEFVYNYLSSKKNETGLTGFIAKAITSEAADAIDELDDDDDEEEEDDEYR